MNRQRVQNLRLTSLTTLAAVGFGHPSVIATVGLLLLGAVILAALLLGRDDRTIPQRILLMACVLSGADPRTALLPFGRRARAMPSGRQQGLTATGGSPLSRVGRGPGGTGRQP